jgi:hypothetical protein
MPISQSMKGTRSQHPLKAGDWRKERTTVDNRHSHQDTGSATNRAHQVSNHGQKTEDGASKGCSGGNDALKFFVHRTFAVPGHNLQYTRWLRLKEPRARCLRLTICWSLSCLATSRGPLPDTSIQVLEKRAQADTTKET